MLNNNIIVLVLIITELPFFIIFIMLLKIFLEMLEYEFVILKKGETKEMTVIKSEALNESNSLYNGIIKLSDKTGEIFYAKFLCGLLYTPEECYMEGQSITAKVLGENAVITSKNH